MLQTAAHQDGGQPVLLPVLACGCNCYSWHQSHPRSSSPRAYDAGVEEGRVQRHLPPAVPLRGHARAAVRRPPRRAVAGLRRPAGRREEPQVPQGKAAAAVVMSLPAVVYRRKGGGWEWEWAGWQWHCSCRPAGAQAGSQHHDAMCCDRSSARCAFQMCTSGAHNLPHKPATHRPTTQASLAYHKP